MAKQTLQEQYAAYLQSKGWTEFVPSPTRKARCFKRPDSHLVYFLGPRGSVRVSRTGKYTDSVDVSANIKRNVQEWQAALMRNHAYIN